MQTAIDLSGPGAAYLRVSDEKQEIETQKPIVTGFLNRHNASIPPANWYIDVDWSRDEFATRPEYQRLFTDAEAGKIKWVIVPAKDRFGHADHEAKLIDYRRLRKAGVRLYSAADGKLLNGYDLTSAIEAVVDGSAEERENRAKSERALSRMKQHAEAGRWLGGTVPPGLDVACLDLTGREVWRVQIDGRDMRVKISPDGSRERYDGPQNFPGRDKTQILTLRPSLDSDRAAVPREVFRWFAREALSTYQIAARLNERAVPHSFGAWKHDHIETMLRNPAYLGIPTWNRTSQAKWAELTGGTVNAHDELNRQQRDHERADWVVAARQFEPIIDPADYETAQAKLAARPTAPRAPKSGSLWLSGLLFCAKCGGNMHGTMRPNQRTRTKRPHYICENYLRTLERRKPDGCGCFLVAHEEVEGWLRNYFGDVSAVWPADTVVTVEQTPEWEASFRRMVESYQAMLARVGGPPRKMMDVEKDFRAAFGEDQSRDRARLDQLEAEERELSISRKDAPTARAKAHIDRRLTELAEEIEALQGRLTNHADTNREAREQIGRLRYDTQAAHEALTRGREATAREKADAVRRVIERVDLTFEPTGRKKGQFYVSRAVIVPKGGKATAEVSNVGTSAPGTTPNAAATRACACATTPSPSTEPPATGG